MAQEEQRPLRIGLEDDQLFQKYIAARVAKEQELEIGTTADLQTGFVTGFDDRVLWLVSTESEDLPAVLIVRDNITSIKETGSTIGSFEGRPDNMAKRLLEYTALIRRKVERELNRN